MVSSNLWPGVSLVMGIIMIWIGILLILVSMPLAKGNVQASKYNYRPIQLYKISDEEKDRLGKPTAIASMAVAMLFVLAGLASIAIGATGNAGPVVMDLFLGTIVLAILALLGILFVSLYFVNRARKKSTVK